MRDRTKTTGTRPFPFVSDPKSQEEDVGAGLVDALVRTAAPSRAAWSPLPSPLASLASWSWLWCWPTFNFRLLRHCFFCVVFIWLLHPISPISSCLLSSPHSTLLLYVTKRTSLSQAIWWTANALEIIKLMTWNSHLCRMKYGLCARVPRILRRS